MTAYRTDPACMLMSPATSLARPLHQCPYCEHVSPANSKFCNECGAALHLKPCPHCGAVNDVTLTRVCARCHGALNEGTAVALIEPEVSAPPRQEAAQRPALTPGGSPSRWPLVLAALGLAGLGLYAFQQLQPTPQPAARPIQSGKIPTADQLTAHSPVAAPLINATAPEPALSEPSALAQQAAAPPVSASAALVVATPSAADLPSATPAVIARQRPISIADPKPNSRSSIEPPPPNLGPCTDAVAALGLCTPAPRRP
jgi:Double zinc ribbon